MPSRAKRQLLWVFGLSLLLAIAAAHLVGQRKHTQFYGDESGWMGASFQTAELLFDGEFDPAHLSAIRRNYGNLNPQLGKLMLGVPLVLYSDAYFGGARFELTTRYNWNGEPYAVKRALGEVPPRTLLHVGRAITAIYGAVCVLVVFVAGWIWFDARVGLVAALLLLLTPTFVEATTRVMTDVYYNLFLLAGCIVASLGVRRAPDGRDLVLAAACGALGGLASAVKITGFLLVGATYCAAVVLRNLREGGSIRRVAKPLATYTATALACIYALNPFYWPEYARIEPRELSREVRQIISGDGAVAFSAPLPDLLGSIAYERREIVAAYPQLYNIARPLEFPVQFLRWKRLWERQEASIPWPRDRSRLAVATRKLALELTAFPFEWIFLVCGGVYCARSVRVGWQARRLSPRIVVLVWVGLVLAGIVTAAPRPEDRFFLPGVIATRILVAAGLLAVVDWVQKWLFADRSPPARPLS